MKLHEAIALRKGEIGRNKSLLAELLHGFKKPAIFNGMVKSYESLDDDGEKLPPESKRVQRQVSKDLKTAQSSIAKLWGIIGAVEIGNTDAKADIEIDGKTIMTGVPVTMLLFLETQLTDMRTLVENIPTLSPDHNWTQDENDGLYKSENVQTHRNKKVQKAITLVAQDEHHAGQAELITVDELAGYWNAVQHSGAMPEVKKAQLVGRVERMLDAVKAARARANGDEAAKADFSPILDNIFG